MKCGCKISYGSYMFGADTIEFCPLHNATLELLAVAKGLIGGTDMNVLAEMAQDAIAKAEAR